MSDNLNNNIFHSYLTDMIFIDSVFEKIYNDLEESYKSKGIELTANVAADKMCDYVMEHFDQWAIENFINERIENKGDEE